MDTKHNYDDIINLNRPKTHRKQMSNYNRAAQFAPFAALNGHSDAIDETARLTDGEIELDEYSKEDMNRFLNILVTEEYKNQDVTIKYYVEDKQKQGGKYISITGRIKLIDNVNRCIVLTDKRTINLDNIIEIH